MGKYKTFKKLHVSGLITFSFVTFSVGFCYTPKVYPAMGKTAGFGLENTHQTKTSNITRDNIHNLKWLWTYETVPGVDPFTEAGVETPPLKQGNVLYFPDVFGYLHAVDYKTGKMIWKKSFFDEAPLGYSDYSGDKPRIVYSSRTTPLIKGDVLYVAAGATILNIVPDLGIPDQVRICETSKDAPGCIPGSTGTYLLAINKNTGNLISATQLDDTFFSWATASPVLHKDIIVTVLASNEELTPDVQDPDYVFLESQGLSPYYRCCRFRGKTVAVKLNGTALAPTPLWTFYHVPSFDGPNNDSSPEFQAKLNEFKGAMIDYITARKRDLDPDNPEMKQDPLYYEYEKLGFQLPRHEGFFGASGFARGNPSVDKVRNFVMTNPGSNYTVPDIVKQCQRIRQGSIDGELISGNMDINAGKELDPEAFFHQERSPGVPKYPRLANLNCDNLNEELGNHVIEIVALDLFTGHPVWTMSPKTLDSEPNLFKYDTYVEVCQARDLGYLGWPFYVYGAQQGGDPNNPSQPNPATGKYDQENNCDPLAKPDDAGIAQEPMILRNVLGLKDKNNIPLSPLDIGLFGSKSGDVFRFDLQTGGQIFYDRIKVVEGGVLGGINMGGSTNGVKMFFNAAQSHNAWRDIRKPFFSTRDDDGQVFLGGVVRKADPRLPARGSGPKSIANMPNPSPDTFIDADVIIDYSGDCSEYDPSSVSYQLCIGNSPFPAPFNTNANPFAINEFGQNPYRRRVTVVHDWRDKAPGEEGSPNTVVNPLPENLASTPGNKLTTVRDLNDCMGAVPESCMIKTVASFIVAMDIRTGEILWTRPHPAGGFINGAHTISGDILYFGASGSEELFVDAFINPEEPNATSLPNGGGLRYALDINTGEILFKFHNALKAQGIDIQEYVFGNPIVLKNMVIWGSGWGSMNTVDPQQSNNQLHAFKLSGMGTEDNDDLDDSDGEDQHKKK